mmetsp:Transcript_54106/g.150463  ORF Transcript_54106/g.150463 Transcript_54106/m.150463 type:complete len:282 (-) Transcript_54106:3626-4471(-)
MKSSLTSKSAELFLALVTSSPFFLAALSTSFISDATSVNFPSMVVMNSEKGVQGSRNRAPLLPLMDTHPSFLEDTTTTGRRTSSVASCFFVSPVASNTSPTESFSTTTLSSALTSKPPVTMASRTQTKVSRKTAENVTLSISSLPAAANLNMALRCFSVYSRLTRPRSPGSFPKYSTNEASVIAFPLLTCAKASSSAMESFFITSFIASNRTRRRLASRKEAPFASNRGAAELSTSASFLSTAVACSSTSLRRSLTKKACIWPFACLARPSPSMLSFVKRF